MFSILVKHSEEYFDNTNNAIIVYTTYKLFNLLTLYKKEIVTTSYEKISRFLPPKEDDMKFVGFKEMMKGDKNDDKNTKKKSRKNAKPKR